MQGEAASVDVEAVASYPEGKIMKMATVKRFFSMNKVHLYCKKMPSRTFTGREEKLMSDFKTSKDWLTLLLGLMKLVT